MCLKHNSNYNFAKISKFERIIPTGIFSYIFIWGVAEKCHILIALVTYRKVPQRTVLCRNGEIYARLQFVKGKYDFTWEDFII